MKVKLRNNANSSRTGVNRSSKYIVVYHKKGETLGMNRILSPNMEKHSFVKAFLDFIARDIQKNPSTIEPLTEDMYRRASLLTEGMEVDIDEEFPEYFIFVWMLMGGQIRPVFNEKYKKLMIIASKYDIFIYYGKTEFVN